MGDLLESAKRNGIDEDDPPEALPVKAAIGVQDALPESIDDLGKSGVPGATTSRAMASESTITAPWDAASLPRCSCRPDPAGEPDSASAGRSAGRRREAAHRNR